MTGGPICNGHRDALALVRVYLDRDDERQDETLRLILEVYRRGTVSSSYRYSAESREGIPQSSQDEPLATGSRAHRSDRGRSAPVRVGSRCAMGVSLAQNSVASAPPGARSGREHHAARGSIVGRAFECRIRSHSTTRQLLC